MTAAGGFCMCACKVVQMLPVVCVFALGALRRRFAMHRPGRLLLVALLAFLSPLASGARAARAGGVPMPEALPPYWITVRPGGRDPPVLKTIPQDPNPLGVRAALFRTEEYPYTFTRITFPSADATPLVGRWSGQRYPRPGVVLVHGFTQSKEQSSSSNWPRCFPGTAGVSLPSTCATTARRDGRPRRRSRMAGRRPTTSSRPSAPSGPRARRPPFRS